MKVRHPEREKEERFRETEEEGGRGLLRRPQKDARDALRCSGGSRQPQELTLVTVP